MADKRSLPNRQTIRLPHFDYASQGAYFVTIVAANRQCVFGEVIGGQLQATTLGRIVQEEWLATAAVRPGVKLEAFVLMQNHVHGIIGLPASKITDASGSLATVVRGFKAAVTKRHRLNVSDPDATVWQRNYYEHIIRDEKDWNAIHAYIAGNPCRWAEDSENPVHSRK